MRIGFPFEGNDFTQSLIERGPTPGVELDFLVLVELDFGFCALKGEGEPDLLLTQKAARPLGR